MSNYNVLVQRNSGYVNADVQKRISSETLGIIGCGIGSTVAEAATRLGFRSFILMDGDIIEPHNLNRQAFAHKDIGSNKAVALGNRIKEINPEAEVQVYSEYLSATNAEQIVRNSDIIVDTIDFLDLEAILHLHDQAHIQKKPIISGMGAGHGCIGIFIPPIDYPLTPFRELFLVEGSGANASYVEHFREVINHLAGQLDPEVQQDLARVFPSMKDAKPCPASQVCSGSYSLASLVMNIINRYYSNREVITFPSAISLNLHNICEHSVISMQEKKAA